VCPIDVPEVALEPGMAYTIAATNDLASIEPRVLVDATTAPADQAQVRVAHFSADAPAVDLLTQDGATTLVSALAYPTATDYLALDAGSYDLKVCAAGDPTVCPLDPAALDLAAGQAYSVFAIGSLEGGSLTAVVGLDASVAPADSPGTEVQPSPRGM
jgi:hypothetical protein